MLFHLFFYNDELNCLAFVIPPTGKDGEQGFDKVKSLWEGWGGLRGGRTFWRSPPRPLQSYLFFLPLSTKAFLLPCPCPLRAGALARGPAEQDFVLAAALLIRPGHINGGAPSGVQWA